MWLSTWVDYQLPDWLPSRELQIYLQRREENSSAKELYLIFRSLYRPVEVLFTLSLEDNVVLNQQNVEIRVVLKIAGIHWLGQKISYDLKTNKENNWEKARYHHIR